MGFGAVLEALRANLKVRRVYWSSYQYLQLQVPDENSKMSQPYIYLTCESAGQPPQRVPWTASHEDLLARDWLVQSA